MCGIVGYIGRAERAQDVILDGLRRLEYRGYDSAGMAVLEDGKLRVVRAVGKLVNLEAALRAGRHTASLPSRTHTRTSRAALRSSVTASSRTTTHYASSFSGAAARSTPTRIRRSSRT
jgi:glucosamine--fructose-6-phosphate aminotransferase (isomerizing)